MRETTTAGPDLKDSPLKFWINDDVHISLQNAEESHLCEQSLAKLQPSRTLDAMRHFSICQVTRHPTKAAFPTLDYWIRDMQGLGTEKDLVATYTSIEVHRHLRVRLEVGQ